MKLKNIRKLLASILICQLAGIIGSIFTAPSIPTWYASLEKPFFTPPAWFIGPVWILLFTLMGISLYLIIKEEHPPRNALGIFALQLLLNTTWPLLFFGLKNPLYALIEIIALAIAIALCIERFSKINKTAAYLLYPYLLWVTFAAVLNYYIWRLNI